MEVYWDAFLWLHETRSVGFDICRISLADMRAYLDLFHVEQSHEWRLDFLLVMRTLDREYIRLVEQRRAIERASKRR